MTNTDKNNFNATIGNTVLCDGFLIPMTDFVNNVGNMENYPSHEKALSWIYDYATFLRQPLKLEMFVPCDEDGDILEKPEDYEKRLPNMMIEYNDEVYRYKQAKEKVLFEGFDVFNSATKNPDIINRNLGIIICFNSIISVMTEGVNGYGGFSDNEILIEQLSQYNLELTPTALDSIFGETVA